jgi:hypothetical protein
MAERRGSRTGNKGDGGGGVPANPNGTGNPAGKRGAGRKTSTDAPRSYEVGYGKPPRHTQFRKGQARPPRKPKPEVEQGFEDWFEEELRQPMWFVDESGVEQTLPKGRVLAKASVNKALKSGDIRQIKDFIPRRPARENSEMTQADLETIARFLAHYFGNAPIEPGISDSLDDPDRESSAGEGVDDPGAGAGGEP